ncbi:MAG: ribosome maturation factor RimP [Actinomycetota bacterium]|nr:ribosome maturation factor RimP [Actinomycetota bacterium]
MSGATEGLWALLQPYLAAEGLELDDLELLGQGRRRLLRVTVDAEGGVDVDWIAEASQRMSRLLDQENAIPGPYTLEVTSPGLERKLRRPEHFRKAVGQEVVVKTAGEVGGERLHQGVLDEADQKGFVVRVDGDPRRVGFEEVASARTVFRWEPAPKPGRKRR